MTGEAGRLARLAGGPSPASGGRLFNGAELTAPGFSGGCCTPFNHTLHICTACNTDCCTLSNHTLHVPTVCNTGCCTPFNHILNICIICNTDCCTPFNHTLYIPTICNTGCCTRFNHTLNIPTICNTSYISIPYLDAVLQNCHIITGRKTTNTPGSQS